MDKKAWMPLVTGCILIVLLIGILIGVQMYEDSKDVVSEGQTREQEREATIDGYEEPEALIQYMLWQMQSGDLDLALRGCAIQKISENFLLRSYIEFMESYDQMALLPPSDHERTSYMEISQLRMADHYAEWLEKCGTILGPGHEVKLLDMVEDVPEEPDGKYYTDRSSICEMLGSQRVREMLISLEVDGEVKEFRWTLTRFGKYWKVLLFTSLENYKSELPEIRDGQAVSGTAAPIDYECEDILPVNYTVLNNNSEEDPVYLLERFFLYLQREDVWSALSYVELYDADKTPSTNAELLAGQAYLAEQMQTFYYRMFFQDQELYAWYFRDLENRASDLVDALNSDKVVTMNVNSIELVNSTSDDSREYKVVYNYGGQGFAINFLMEDRNGWRIKSMALQ